MSLRRAFGQVYAMEASVTMNFLEVEPGWTCIYFKHPPRLAKSRLHSLLGALETWRQHHPHRRIEQLQVVKHGKLVRGLNVYWSNFEHLQDRGTIAHFHIDPIVRDLFGHEYAEAIMQDAVAFAANHGLPDGNLVMISRRKVAILVMRATSHAYVTTFDNFAAMLNADLASELARGLSDWITRESQETFFCAVLPDDFQPSR